MAKGLRMGEINYDFNFLFKKDEDVKSFAEEMVANKSDSRREPIAFIKQCWAFAAPQPTARNTKIRLEGSHYNDATDVGWEIV